MGKLQGEFENFLGVAPPFRFSMAAHTWKQHLFFAAMMLNEKRQQLTREYASRNEGRTKKVTRGERDSSLGAHL